jgi:2-amino-4-hydroxy-6-hydroxymethyldihydropteridine diphosphokinase
MKYHNKAWLLTGGNLGDREKTLATALEHLNTSGCHVTKISALYETHAWGKTDQPSYLNQAVEISTNFSAVELMKHLLLIERDMGRERQEKYAARIIDIDILLFNDEVYHEDILICPHPQLQNRRFALTPLSEIAPTLIHPVLKKTIAELLDVCRDKLPVKKYS